jgi:2'-5' RNA ligase
MPALLRGEEQMTSIWLRPQGDQEQALQNLIDRIAGDHGTVPFPPHLTVCGVPDLTVLDAAAAYVKRCGLLPLRVAKIAVTGAVITPFRAVFIEVENSPELREFRERLRDITGAAPLIPPHISLLYTLDRVSQMPRPDFDAERLEGIAARCAAEIRDTQVTLARPIVNNAGGGETNVRGWRVLREL